MHLYRIVKSLKRVNDLSGLGAFNAGGRWNNKGTYMLYTSETSSLAYLEILVHFSVQEFPSDLYIMQLSLPDNAPIYELPGEQYPGDWMEIGQSACKNLGDRWMQEKKYIAIKVRSAVNHLEYNYLLNPLFPKFNNLLKITTHTLIRVDDRLISKS